MGPRFALGPRSFAALTALLLLLAVVVPSCAMQGVRTDHLKLLSSVGSWTTSRSHDVWNHVLEYDDWRKEMIVMLQTLRIFDALLSDLGQPALRIINHLGAACGLGIVLGVAARRSTSTSRDDDSATDDRSAPANTLLPTLADIKHLAFQL